MIEFFTALWGQLGVLWDSFVLSIPGWIDYAIEGVKALGIGGIIIIISKWVIPVLKNANNPVVKRLAEMTELILTLNGKVEAADARVLAFEQKDSTINDLLVQYMSLSCQTNSESRTLTAERKGQYEALAASFLAAGNTKMAEAITVAISDDVVTPQEVLEIANIIPVVSEVLESTPAEIVSTVEKSRRKLRQRS